MRIRKIEQDKSLYLSLLLIADPSEEQIGKYLDRSQLFIGFESDIPVCCAAVMPTGPRTAELKNLAVIPLRQKCGLGGQMIRLVENRLRCQNIRQLTISTGSPGKGEPPFYQEVFYRRCGFEPYGYDPGYFTANYPEPLYEEDGRQCIDRVLLRKILG